MRDLTLDEAAALYLFFVLLVAATMTRGAERNARKQEPRPSPPPASPNVRPIRVQLVPSASGASGTGERCESLYGGQRCILPTRHLRPCVPEERLPEEITTPERLREVGGA